MPPESIGHTPHLATSHQLLRLRTFFLILVMIVANPLGNVLLGRGMKHVGTITVLPLSKLVQTGVTIFETPTIWLGIASLIAFFLSYMLVLSWADYTFVLPVSSIGYGVTALFAYLILGEKVSAMRWAGIAIICLGVFIVGRTTPRTTTHEATEQI